MRTAAEASGKPLPCSFTKRFQFGTHCVPNCHGRITDKDESIVKYSVLADNENLFASKYRLYLPTEEELKAELQRERELIERQIEEI